jgi:ParB-like chromosome segregation protein Spo0J
MNIEVVKIKDIKTNPNNPRVIKDDKFHKLCESIKTFPKMLELRPIVVNDDMVVLGGNMRLKALKHLGLTEAPVIKASELTEEQQRQFIIKDNVGFGEWDWDMLANEWDTSELSDWGLEVWQPQTEADYSILDDINLDSEIDDLASGVKKAIQIEFDIEHYPEAQELVKFWREREAYIGGMILEYLREEKNKL